MSQNTILAMRSITKEFPGVKALDSVSLEVRTGEIHALVGENGAGKSTLMKVLSGVYPTGTYHGDIEIDNRHQQFHSIKESEQAGVAIIYQELALVKQMTICENIFLGSEIATSGIIHWDRALKATKKILEEVGLDLDPLTRIINLGVGHQQLVEIAKALSKKAKILILDEPTAALTIEETELLMAIIRKLKERGVSCIYISHRLNEVFALADRITVLRDGKTICTRETKELTQKQLIAHMVGRELNQLFPKGHRTPGEVVMHIDHWSVFDEESGDIALRDISLEIRKGEVLGIAGLVGAGRSELLLSLFGVWGKRISGEIRLQGKRLSIKNPHDAIKAGISLVTEDRKRFGLILGMDVEKNITLASLEKIAYNNVIINQNEEVKASRHYVSELAIKTPSIEQLAGNLSGGNQQKVVLSKWLMTEPKVLILDEPTRGIDIGAKSEIYTIINSLVEKGVCVVLVSSELPEILGMCDRVVVMHEGRISGELATTDATQEKIMHLATGS